jgi:probable F420-dependent oxidoreductase
MGAGWYRAEYERMGIAFEPAGARIARLEEAVAIIKALLAGETVTFAGAHYMVSGLSLPVRPAQRPHPPLLIGGGGPKMLALAARVADIVGILPAPIRGDDGDDPRDRAPAALEDKLGVIRAAAGSRFGELELSTFATFVITDHRRRDTEELARSRGWSSSAAGDIWEMPSVFIGSVAQIAEDLQARRARYGLSYYVTTDRAAGVLAQIIGAG